MSANTSGGTPAVALCPRCHFPINPRQWYNVNVDFCMPAPIPPPPLLSTTPAGHVTNQHRDGELASSSQPENDCPSSALEPPSSSRSPEQAHDTAPPSSSSTKVASPGPSANHERRSSAASTDYFAEFDRLSINTEFENVLRQTEAQYFPQEAAPTPSSPPTSSPSTESSLIPSTSGELVSPPNGRRWVVFRGRVPGVYRSSADATRQTESFPDALQLAFEDPAQGYNAFKRFLENGTIPAHGRGPWVVYVGRTRGVFTSYNDLHASVRGYPNNIYRCCESVEEGRRALDKYLSKRPEAPTLPLVSSDAGRSKSPVTKPASPHLAEHPIPDAPKDESWWCCFAGAEPGVYMGLESLTRAFPAPGGVRRVNSEEEGWNLWTAFLADGRVQVVPRE